MIRFRKSDIIRYANTMLGANDVSVELVDADWDEVFNVTLSRYNQCRPKLLKFISPVSINQGTIKMNPATAGRGVYNVVFAEDATDSIYTIPVLEGYSYPIYIENIPYSTANTVTTQVLNRMTNQVAKQINGEDDWWEYNRDTYELVIKPPRNISQTIIIYSMFDKYFGEYSLDNPNIGGVVSGICKDTYGNDIIHINPHTFNIVLNKNNQSKVYITDKGDGKLYLSGTDIGTINYITGEINFTLADSSNISSVSVVINEIRSTDEQWFKDYVYANACIIIGNKRSKFSSIPSTQKDVNLDVAKLQQGIDLKEKLDEKSSLWMWEWLIPKSV